MTETLGAAMSAVDQQLQQSVQAGSLKQSEVAAKSPHFTSFTPKQVPADRGLDHLFAVKLEAEAVLGRSNFSVDEMLSLGVGSVIELDRLVSEPVDLLVQNVRVHAAKWLSSTIILQSVLPITGPRQ